MGAHLASLFTAADFRSPAAYLDEKYMPIGLSIKKGMYLHIWSWRSQRSGAERNIAVGVGLEVSFLAIYE